MPVFDIEAALKDGATIQDVASFLSGVHGFDYGKAKTDGIKDEDIALFLKDRETVPKSSEPEVEGGMLSSAKNVVGQTIKGAGQAYADFVPGADQENQATEYGKELIAANPLAVNEMGDIAKRPGQAVSEAVGNTLPSVGAAVTVGGVGRTISSLPYPAAKAIGKLIEFVGPAVVAGLPSYGSIRDKQAVNSPETNDSFRDKAIAALGASAVGAIEQALGPQQWAKNMLTREGREFLAAKLASDRIGGSVALGVAKGALEEAGEEVAQSPIEQISSFDNPFSAESLKDTAFGGAMGAIGGGLLGGGVGAVSSRKESPEIDNYPIKNPEPYSPGSDSAIQNLTVPDVIIPPVKQEDFNITIPAEILSAGSIDEAIANTESALNAPYSVELDRLDPGLMGTSQPSVMADQERISRVLNEASLERNFMGRVNPETSLLAQGASTPLQQRAEREAEYRDVFTGPTLLSDAAEQRLALLERQMSDGEVGQRFQRDDTSTADGQSVPGEWDGVKSTNPEWIKSGLLKEAGKAGVRKVIDKMRAGYPLTNRQAAIWSEIKKVADKEYENDPATVAAKTAEKIQQEHGIELQPAQNIPVGNLQEGDKVVIEGKNGIPDVVTHKGMDRDGKAILQDGVTVHADPWDMVSAMGVKQNEDKWVRPQQPVAESAQPVVEDQPEPLPRDIGATQPAEITGGTAEYLQGQRERRDFYRGKPAVPESDAQGFIRDQQGRQSFQGVDNTPQSVAGNPSEFLRDQGIRRDAVGKVSEPMRRQPGESTREFIKRRKAARDAGADTAEIDSRIGEAEAAGVVLSDRDKRQIKEDHALALRYRTEGDRLSNVDPMGKGYAFPMGVGFTKMTKRKEQALDSSVKKAGIAVERYRKAETLEKSIERRLAGKGTEADTADKAAKRTSAKEEIAKRIATLKKGDTFGKDTVERVSKSADGYPESITISGDGIVKGVFDKINIVKELFDGDSAAYKGMVDRARAESNAPTDTQATGAKTNSTPDLPSVGTETAPLEVEASNPPKKATSEDSSAVQPQPSTQGESDGGEVGGSRDGFTYTADDIPLELARQAHAGSSFSPGKRAVQEREGYARHMDAVVNSLLKHANTEEKKDALKTWFNGYYRPKYVTMQKALLSTNSRTMSSMITGPANFPVRSNQKKLDTANKRMTELLEWDKKAVSKMRNELVGSTAISSTDKDAKGKLEAKLETLEKAQQVMRDANKVVRNKKLSDAEKIDQLVELGIQEKKAPELLQPDFSGRIGFASYALTNNKAEINRIKGRISEQEQRAAKVEEVGGSVETPFEGGRVEQNYEDGYIRIYHDDKPSAEIRAQLKSNGFRWAPSEGAWRRKLNNSAKWKAEEITGVKLSKSQPSTTPGETTPADIRAEVSANLGKFRTMQLMRRGVLNVVATQEEAEANIQNKEDAFRSEQTGSIQGYVKNGKVTLVADGIQSGNAYQVFLHEITHATRLGLNSNANFKRLLDTIERHKGQDTALGEAIDTAEARIPDDTNPEHWTEEILAYLIENDRADVGIVRRFIAMVKKVLVNMGVSPDIFSKEDFKALAVNAAKWQSTMATGGNVMRSVREMFKPVDVESENFKNWIKGSEIQGVVYSGQPKGRFIFEDVVRSELGGVGFFTRSRGVAALYAGTSSSEKTGETNFSGGRDGEVGKYYVSVKNSYNPDSYDISPKEWLIGISEKFDQDFDDLDESEKISSGWEFLIKKFGYPDNGRESLEDFKERGGKLVDYINDNIVPRTVGQGIYMEGISSTKFGALAISFPDVFEKIRTVKGFDALIYEDGEHGGEETIVVFSPTQVKSAISNTGAFSPTDPRIQYSRASNESGPMSLENLESVATDMSEAAKRGSIKVLKSPKKDSNFWERLFSTPEYYFKKKNASGQPGASARVLQAALLRRDVRFEKQAAILGDFVTFVQALRKENKAAYEEANDYLVGIDQGGTGFKISQTEDGWAVIGPDRKKRGVYEEESGAISEMIKMEGAALRELGFSDQSIEAVKMARELTNRGFDVMAEDMRRIIAEAKENGLPDPYVSDAKIDEAGRYGIYAEGRKTPIALFASEQEAKERLAVVSELVSYAVVSRSGKMRNFNSLMKAKAWAAKRGGKVDKAKRFANLSIRKRTDKEMRPMTVKEALAQMGDLRGTYFPRIRESGEYVLKARKDGENPFRQNFDLPGVGDGNLLQGVLNSITPIGRKAKELKAKGYEVTIERDTKPTDDVFDATKLITSLDAILQDSMGLVDKNDSDEVRASQHIDQILTMQIADIFKARGYLASRMQRLSGEEVWEGYETDMGKALTQYGKNIGAGTAKRDTARQMVLAFTGRDYTWKQYKEEVEDPKWDEYKAIVEERRIDPGKEKNLFKDVRGFMVDVLRNDEQADRIIGTMKGLAVHKFLGFRLSSAAVNATNMVTGVVGTMSGHTGESIPRSMRRVTAAAIAYGKYRSGMGEISDADRELFQEITRRGWDEAQFDQEAMSELRSKAGEMWNKYATWSMYMFSAAEKANRAMTLFAAYKGVSAKNPKMEADDVWEAAKEISDRAHGVYGKETMPAIARGGELNRALRLPLTFTKFTHNYMLNILDLGFSKKEYKAAAYLLLSPALIAGSGATVAAPVVFALAGALGIGGDDPEEVFYDWMADTFGSDAFARHGLAGLAGINIKGSLQVNLPMPADIAKINAASLAGPVGGIVSDAFKGASSIAKGDISKGVEVLLPTAFGSMLKSARESSEGITTSNYGSVFYGDEPLKADTVDAVLRFFSFNPSRISGIREKQWNEKEVAAKYQEKRTKINNAIKRDYLQGKPALNPERMKEIKRYNELVKGSGRRDISPMTVASIRMMLKRASRPGKMERLRAAETM